MAIPLDLLAPPTPAPSKPAAGVRRAGSPVAATDGELLALFVRSPTTDGSAFDRLVDRHGAMVWGVCRRLLNQPQDAEDAFQATFLILARRARSIRASESVAGWLYRVAYRTALSAKRRARRRRETPLEGEPLAAAEDAFPDLVGRQTAAVLMEELDALPAKYRTPIVMRYLEGRSRRAIADQTDTTIATVQGRLARGKKLLRSRLVRRGVSLSAAMAIVGLGADRAQGAPAHLVSSTTSSATALVTGGSVAASAAALSLYREGVRAMLIASIGKPLAATAALGVVLAGLAAPPALFAAGEETAAPVLTLAAEVDADSAIDSTAPATIAAPLRETAATVAAGVPERDAERAVELSEGLVQQLEYALSVYQRAVAKAAVEGKDGFDDFARRDGVARLEDDALPIEPNAKALRRQLDVAEQSLADFRGDGGAADSLEQRLWDVSQRAVIAEEVEQRINNAIPSLRTWSGDRPITEAELNRVAGFQWRRPPPDSDNPVAKSAFAKENLRYGHSVHRLQAALNERLKPEVPLWVDGDYGPNTEAAVKRLQREMDAEPTGLADEAVRRELGLRQSGATDVSAPAERAELDAAPNEPLVPLLGSMRLTEAEELRRQDPTVKVERSPTNSIDGEPMANITRMVTPAERRRLQRQGINAEINAAAARHQALGMKRDAIVAELQSLVRRSEDAIPLAKQLLLVDSRMNAERARIRHYEAIEEEPDAAHNRTGERYRSMNAAYGHSVERLQEALNDRLTPSPGLDVDGDYGPQTSMAVARLQREEGVPATGFANAETRERLGLDDRPVELPPGPSPDWNLESGGVVELAARLYRLRRTVEDDLRERVHEAIWKNGREDQAAAKLQHRLASMQATFQEFAEILADLGHEDGLPYPLSPLGEASSSTLVATPSESDRATVANAAPRPKPVVSPPPVPPTAPPEIRSTAEIDGELSRLAAQMDRLRDEFDAARRQLREPPPRPPEPSAIEIEKLRLQLEAAIAKAKAEAAKAEAELQKALMDRKRVSVDLERKRKLAEDGFVSEPELQNLEQRDESVAQVIRIAERQLAEARTRIERAIATRDAVLSRLGVETQRIAPVRPTNFQPVKAAPGALTGASRVDPAQRASADTANQYGPDSKMKQGQWNVYHRPSELNSNGWATIALLRVGEHAPVLLPGDERPRPHLRLASVGEAKPWSHGGLTLQLVDSEEAGDTLYEIHWASPTTIRMPDPVGLIEVACLTKLADKAQPILLLLRQCDMRRRVGLPSVDTARRMLFAGNPQDETGRIDRTSSTVAPPPFPAPPTAPKPNTLRLGHAGEDVERLQQWLNARVEDLPEPLDIDGDFGPLTARALAVWQRENGEEPTGRIERDRFERLYERFQDRRSVAAE